ncbi:MAG: biotin--[acetyl-CoA-carboxylase] ligase [Candidatus Omnitrophica bacterium]|nr:biotin--[acetyl-CoA-carboxylase] ligase [Candidatus Omnitrophota bacterium]
MISDFEILEFLRGSDTYVSGEDLSRHLKISRSAVWKHIQELRQSGYEISAVPHLGYRLDALTDKLFPQEITSSLNTKFVGRKIHYYESVSSTMDIATKLAVEGEEEGAIVCAESQSRGRGRIGRQWFSPKAKGIYISLILRPNLPPSEAAKLTILSAVSCCKAINEETGVSAGIKWPNDLLVRGRKAGGILTELNAETDRVRFVVIGIGINVNNARSGIPDYATSLRQERGESVCRVSLLRAILRRIEADYIHLLKYGASSIINEWRGLSLTLHSRVKVVCYNREVVGEAQDIDSDGGLLIRKDSGLVEKVFAGDVVKAG